ncbi:GNAT family N-acetyltransferase [Blastococcus sp. SYSU DS0617]
MARRGRAAVLDGSLDTGNGGGARRRRGRGGLAFDLGLQRLELQHSTRNRASCRVAEKTGFDLEGTKRRAGLHQDGWHDMHLHARLA